jgi:hypothetical protein
MLSFWIVFARRQHHDEVALLKETAVALSEAVLSEAVLRGNCICLQESCAVVREVLHVSQHSSHLRLR